METTGGGARCRGVLKAARDPKGFRKPFGSVPSLAREFGDRYAKLAELAFGVYHDQWGRAKCTQDSDLFANLVEPFEKITQRIKVLFLEFHSHTSIGKICSNAAVDIIPHPLRTAKQKPTLREGGFLPSFDEMIVLGVRADPEPGDNVMFPDTDRTIAASDPNGVDGTLCMDPARTTHRRRPPDAARVPASD